MIDPEATGHNPAAAAQAAASRGAAGRQAVIAQDPAIAAPRRRRRRLAALVTVVVAGLAAGLLVWAPWVPPPVLRPAGLAAGPASATSVTLRWSRPPTGPLPDKYLIVSYGRVTGVAAGRAVSYRQTGLNPGSTHLYRVVAVRGGKRSPASAPLALDTITPPVSQARLQGAWDVTTRNRHVSNFIFSHKPGSAPETWTFSPVCATGACSVILHGPDSLAMKLTRAGAMYRGQAVDNSIPCGSGASSVPDPLTLKIHLRVTAAVGKNQLWAASTWTGAITGTSPYVSGSTFYCPAGAISATLHASLSG